MVVSSMGAVSAKASAGAATVLAAAASRVLRRMIGFLGRRRGLLPCFINTTNRDFDDRHRLEHFFANR
jgi:hypothetical protein